MKQTAAPILQVDDPQLLRVHVVAARADAFDPSQRQPVEGNEVDSLLQPGRRDIRLAQISDRFIGRQFRNRNLPPRNVMEQRERMLRPQLSSEKLTAQHPRTEY